MGESDWIWQIFLDESTKFGIEILKKKNHITNENNQRGSKLKKKHTCLQ